PSKNKKLRREEKIRTSRNLANRNGTSYDLCHNSESCILLFFRSNMNKNETPHDCDPREIALKSFFLGPQAENAGWIGELLSKSFNQWVSWRRSLYPADGSA